MVKTVFILMVIGIFLFPFAVFGQKMSEKIVRLPAGQSTLGATLKSISEQTSCVFSYDPTIVMEKQVVQIPKGFNYTLQVALRKVLPAHIQFKFKEKYILLLKCAPPKPKQAPIDIDATSKNHLKATEKTVASSSLQATVIVQKQDTDIVVLPKTDSVVPTTIVKTDSTNIQLSKTPPTVESRKEIKVKPNSTNSFLKNIVLEAEISAYNKMLATSLHVGYYGIYVLAAYGKNAEQVVSRGLGLGANFQLTNTFGAVIELERETQITGKTYDLGVRTELTTIKPLLNYGVGKSIKVFAGPTFNMFNSKYVNGIKTYDLGKTFYYGAIIGLKLDLMSLFRKQS